MAYKSQYTGEQIDLGLTTSEGIDTTTIGWFTLSSSKEDPFDLNNLVNPGNYTISYWDNGPSFPESFKGPLNIVVSKIITQTDALIYQIIEYIGVRYIRKYNGSNYESWELNTSASIYVGPSYLYSTINENDVWIDTSDANNPKFKIYREISWVDINYSDIMVKSTYDKDNKETDLYEYMKSKVISLIGDVFTEGSTDELTEHIANTTIHTTQEELDDWLDRVTDDDITTSKSTIESTLDTYADNNMTNLSSNKSSVEDKVSSHDSTLTTHINNTTIHPDSTKQTKWSNKAEGNHTHNLDGRVKVSTSDISGVLPLELIDQSALERMVTVADDTARLALTTDTIQNGDQIYVEDTKVFYFVVDDTKLGTESAFKPFATGSSYISWENVTNKPSTISGFGITDAQTKSTVNSNVSSKITTPRNNLTTAYNKVPDLEDFDLDGFMSDLQSLSYFSISRQNTINNYIKSIRNNLSQIDSLL
jgi:hypothetical protein